AVGGSVTSRMLVEYVVTAADVHGRRNGMTVSRREHAQVFVRIIACVDAAAGVLAQAQAERGGFGGPVVELSGFAPQAELAGANITRDAFGGCAGTCQLVIVNDAGAVHGDA